MRKCCFLFIGLLFFSKAHSQAIQYSKTTFRNPYYPQMKLVADIGGYHHLIFFSAERKPLIYVFNPQMQLVAQKELNTKVRDTYDTQIVPFGDEYVLYMNSPAKTWHEMFRVSGNGAIINASEHLTKVVDSVLPNTKTSFQVLCQGDRLYLMAYTYYNTIKKMGATVIALNKKFGVAQIRKRSFPFEMGKEKLQQAMLYGRDLMVLKTIKDVENGNSMEVIKINIDNGGIESNSFNTGSYVYAFPAFRYNARDSSFLLYSLISEPPGSSHVQRTVFIAKLDYRLQETTPMVLLKRQFRNNTVSNFLLPGDYISYWLNMPLRVVFKRDAHTSALRGFGNNRNPSAFADIPNYGITYNDVRPMRLTLLDNSFKLIEDSLVLNDSKIHNLMPAPFAQFEMNGKAYLVLIENFSQKQRGLLLVHKDQKDKLTTTGIPVYARYNYELSLLQAVKDEYFILPYTNKNEIGLVKISMKK